MKKLPQELEVWFILPAIKKELAKELYRKKLKQKQIAKILELTEPAVSHYIKNKRANKVKFTNKFLKEIKKSVNNILKNNKILMYEIYKLSMLAKKDLTLCKLHKKYEKIPEKCEVCLR